MIHPVNSRLQRIAFPNNNTHAGSIQSVVSGIAAPKNGIAKPATDQTDQGAYRYKKRHKDYAALHFSCPLRQSLKSFFDTCLAPETS
jgi:hypothetical protein